MLPKWAIDACEEIDAGFFSGDSFLNKKAMNELEWYLNRWTKQLKLNQEAMIIADKMVKRHP